MSGSAPASPFKFLDAYSAQDSAIFFGRDDEIDDLYRLLTESRLVMVYGASGTGKTSLVQCGLTHKFSPTNWLPLTVRRSDDIGASLTQVLKASAITPLKDDATTVEAIRSVYLDHLRPIYLIFDQFEELYVLGSKDEQDAFYATIRSILEADVSCRIVILLREEYLAALDPFERAVPSLFDKRLRVEVMTNSNVEKVIVGTCAANGIVLEYGADTARLIIDQLDDKRIGVQLAYLQVYLDHLYRAAAPLGSPVTFTDAAIAEAGKLGDIMAGFLDDQEKAIEAELGPQVPAGAVGRLLEEFVSVEGTKQPSTQAEVLARIPSAGPWLQGALDLLQNSRLLRRVDDHYELAHDALAGRIAERRSGERKQLLMVEKLVQNRMGEYAQTKTWLNPEELALVNQASKLKDPLDGSPLLRLDEQGAKFVGQSRWANRKRRFSRIGLIFVALLIPLLLLLWNFAQSQDADDNSAYASNIADVMGFGALLYAREQNELRLQQEDAPPPDPSIFEIAEWVHQTAKSSNIDRDLHKSGTPTSQAQMDASFWGRLYTADSNFFGDASGEGMDAARNPDFVRKTYGDLEDEQRAAHVDSPWDVLTTGKLKAVLWHHYFALADKDEKLGNELLDVMLGEVSQIEGDPIGFVGDLYDFCNQKDLPKSLQPKCRPYITDDMHTGGSAPLATEPAHE